MTKNKTYIKYYLVFIVNTETDKITKKIILASKKSIDVLNQELNEGHNTVEVNYIYGFLEKDEGYDRIEEIDKIELVSI